MGYIGAIYKNCQCHLWMIQKWKIILIYFVNIKCSILNQNIILSWHWFHNFWSNISKTVPNQRYVNICTCTIANILYMWFMTPKKVWWKERKERTQYQMDFIWATKSDTTNLYEKVIAKVLYFGECNNSAIQNLDP